MMAVGVVASEQVLSRLASTQERQIKDLTNAYLDGLASRSSSRSSAGTPGRSSTCSIRRAS